MRPTESRELSRAVVAITAAGPPGAHLSVAIAGGRRSDAVRGHAQAFDDAGPREIALTAGHAHDLGSVTKVAGTTAMLVALASTGSVTVDDPVGRYLPSLPEPLAGAGLRDLLTHRAGLWEWWPTYLGVPDAVAVDGRGVPAGADPLDMVAALPLRYPPRTGRHYSDLGFMLLGRVVETVTGQPLPAAHAELIAAEVGTDELTYAAPPAGHPAVASGTGDRIERQMVATGTPYPVPVPAGAVDGFAWRPRVEVGEVNDGNAFHSFGGAAGHAGLFGTVTGLHALGAAWLGALDGDGRWPALREFCRPGPDDGQLLGVRSWTSAVPGCTAQAIGHTGYPGIGFAVLPDHGASVVLATNRLHVRGEAAAFDPLWQQALAAAHRDLHDAGDGPDALGPAPRGHGST
jgi:CubicO group peptidase (beta-lactamase class C family)